MADSKRSTYKGFTEAQARANKKYLGQFVDVKIRVLPDERDTIKSHAQARGESVNGFIKRAIDETMDRDNASERP